MNEVMMLLTSVADHALLKSVGGPDVTKKLEGLKVVQCSRNLQTITPRYTTTSIMKGISKVDRLISKNAVSLLLSDFKSALHKFV